MRKLYSLLVFLLVVINTNAQREIITNYSMWEFDSNNFAIGQYPTDLNGDGFVDPSDYSIWEENSNNFIFSIYPGL